MVLGGLSSARRVDGAGVCRRRVRDICFTAQAGNATQQFLAVSKLRHTKSLHVVLAELKKLGTRDGVLCEGLAKLSEFNALEPSRNF